MMEDLSLRQLLRRIRFRLRLLKRDIEEILDMIDEYKRRKESLNSAQTPEGRSHSVKAKSNDNKGDA